MRKSCPLLWLVGAASACAHPDYGMSNVVEDTPPVDVPVDLVIDVAWQDNDWGRNVTRCQVQVAFEPRREHHGDSAGGNPGAGGNPESGGPDPGPDNAMVPDEPGTCVFTEIPRPGEHHEGEPGQEPGGDPGHEPGEDDPILPGDAEDDWQVRGDVVGPDEIFMKDGATEVRLDSVEVEGGGLRYELADCDATRFPFSSNLALDVAKSSQPNGVHAFTMADLIAVGPRLFVDEPAEDEHGMPMVRSGDDLALRWAFEGADPSRDGKALTPEVLVKLYTQHRDRTEADRWLICRPEEEGWFDIPSEALDELMSGIDNADEWFTNFDIHSELRGQEQETPWGELLQVRAHVSAGGAILLEGRD